MTKKDKLKRRHSAMTQPHANRDPRSWRYTNRPLARLVRRLRSPSLKPLNEIRIPAGIRFDTPRDLLARSAIEAELDQARTWLDRRRTELHPCLPGLDCIFFKNQAE